jgi:hypothetical protein
VNCLSIADIGIGGRTAPRDVYDLREPSDILGTYTAITPGAAVGGGLPATFTQDEHSFRVRMTAMRSGLALILAPAGMTISTARQ